MQPSWQSPTGVKADPEQAEPEQEPAPQSGDPAAAEPERRTLRRWQKALIAAVGSVALFAVLLRVSYDFPLDSDSANNALQAWGMLHGNVLLHGWIVGDATYFAFELPLFVIADAIFGLGSIDTHAVAAAAYALVILSTAAVARTGTRGKAAAARTAIVLAILSVPLLLPHVVGVLLEKPDHTGTTAITMVCFLLADRVSAKRYTAPLLCLILALGELGDATVLYVTVPAIILVSAFRIIQKRRIRSADAAFLLAAIVSVPLEMLLRKGILSAGGYLEIAPHTQLAHRSMLGLNWHYTWSALQVMYGAVTGPDGGLGWLGAALGYLSIVAAIYGFGRVIVTWLRASRAEQMLCVAIVVNIAAYLFSTLPMATNPREVVLVVPAGAALAARGLVRPGRQLAGRLATRLRGSLTGHRAWAALAAAGILALVPLTAAAVQPVQNPYQVQLAAWLKAHKLSYGIAGYWNASAVTLISGGSVNVRAVSRRYFGFSADDWETNWTWYYPTVHDATFAIAGPEPGPGHPQGRTVITAANFEQVFGKPAAIYPVAGVQVLIYHKNLLLQVAPALPIPPDNGPHVWTPRPAHT